MIIGIGCDIVDISRINLEIKNKVLSQKELDYCKDFNEKRLIEFIAGRFAAKEAIIKSINEQVLLSDIEVFLENNELKCRYKNYKIKVSIAHEKNMAIGFAICED